MKIIKKFICVMLMIIFIGSLISSKALAISYKNMGEKTGVELNKSWIIKFNVPVDKSSINNKNIVILDKNNKSIKTYVTLIDSKTISVRPINNYNSNSTYTLIVKKGIKSKKGKIIKSEAKLRFTTRENSVKPSGKYIVALDAGRALNDIGFEVGPSGVQGKDINLNIVLKMGKILENNGIKVVYTRKGDNVSWNPVDSIYSRSKIINDSRADVFLSIHCNSSNLQSTHGFESYYLEGDNLSKDLASYVQDELHKKTKLLNRGIKSSKLKTLSEVDSVGAYVDLGFITNPIEEKILSSDDYQNNSAKGLANAILKYLKENGDKKHSSPSVVDEKIKLVNDIKVNLIQGENYILPKEITAITESNKETKVDVEWETSSINTNLVGTMKIKGKIKGMEKPVFLCIVVNPKDHSQHVGRRYKVAIDPGHGGYDSGALGHNGTKEKNIALKVGLKLGDILSKQGIDVVYTRTSDKCPWPSDKITELQMRCDIANDENADYFVSIHCNSAGGSSAVGIETYYDRSKTNGIPLAKNIQGELIDEFKARDRGVKGSGLYVVKHTTMPAVLVELEFISNPEKENLLNDEEYQERYAKAISRGILNTIY